MKHTKAFASQLTIHVHESCPQFSKSIKLRMNGKITLCLSKARDRVSHGKEYDFFTILCTEHFFSRQ